MSPQYMPPQFTDYTMPIRIKILQNESLASGEVIEKEIFYDVIVIDNSPETVAKVKEAEQYFQFGQTDKGHAILLDLTSTQKANILQVQ